MHVINFIMIVEIRQVLLQYKNNNNNNSYNGAKLKYQRYKARK